MAAIFKRNGRDGKPAKKWSYKFKDERGKWVTKTGHRLKEKTERMAEADEDRAKRIQKGELTPTSEVILVELLEIFRTNLEVAANSERYVSQTVNRVKRIFDACQFTTLADLRAPAALDQYKAFLAAFKYKKGKKGAERGCSQQTINHYTTTLKTFCHWAVTSRKMPDCPLLTLKKTKITVKKGRRAATVAECDKLLKAAGKGDELYGLTGEERAILYRLALNTGFRVSELASLTPSSFHIDAKSAYVELRASDAKNRQTAEQPIPAEFAVSLGKFLNGLPSDQLIWPGDWKLYAARMLRTDLMGTGITGLDFHSLRTTFITNLARAGVHPRRAQQLARHSDINLTMAFYTKLDRDELANDLPCI